MVAPSGAFSADDALYVEMARAMAENGSLRLTAIDAPGGAPAMARPFAPLVDGAPAPQYPSGYAFVGAPFFAVAGVNGLMGLNALSFMAAVWLTFSLARRLGANAGAAAGLFAGATFASSYALAIWPHMLTLAMTLAAARLTLDATGAAAQRFLTAGGAGFLIALAASVRVDAMLAAAALFLWLRLFGAPSDRRLALSFGAGLAPGLALCASVNLAKFGIFQPFTYGATGGFDSASRYAPLMLAFAAVAAASMLTDVSSPRMRALLRDWRKIAAAAAAVFAAAIVIAPEPVVNYAHALYALVGDLQSLPDTRLQPGLERGADGWLAFWGLPKKALAQSIPYLALALLPLAGFFCGRRVRETAFCSALAAAPIAFYALNYWHGGMAFNMRYFLPVLPFIAILAAFALDELRACQPFSVAIAAALAILGSLAASWFLFILPAQAPALATPARIYPQLVLAVALSMAIGALLLRYQSRAHAAVAAGLASLAIGYAVTLGAADFIGTWSFRAKKEAVDRVIAEIVPPRSLVLTLAEDLLVGASLKGAAIVRVNENTLPSQHQLIDAYESAGRCVFIHLDATRGLIADARLRPVVDARLGASPAAALYVLPALGCR